MARRFSIKLYLAVSLIATALLIAGVTIAIPSIDDFDPMNPLWNGYSTISSVLGVRYISLSAIGDLGEGSALMIVAPETDLSNQDIESLRSFLERGGVLIVADEYTRANNILRGLGSDMYVLGPVVVDPLYKYRSSRIVAGYSNAINVSSEIYLNYASALNIDPSSPRCVIYTSPFSFLDTDLDGSRSPDEPVGPFCVAAYQRVGSGYLYVFSDSSLWINSMAGLGGNLDVLESIAGGRDLYVVSDVRVFSLYSQVRGALASLLNLLVFSSIRYVFVFLIAFAAYRLGGFIYGLLRPIGGGGLDQLCRAVDNVIRVHPDWDRGVVEGILGDLYGSRIRCGEDKKQR